MSDDFRLSLPAVDLASASGDARRLLERAQRETRMIPNMYARMANAPALLATYQDGYASFRAESGFNSAEQEVVFLAISREHECAYCLAAHSFVADVLSRVPSPTQFVTTRRFPTASWPRSPALSDISSRPAALSQQP